LGLTDVLIKQKKYDEAEAMNRAELASARSAKKPDPVEISSALHSLGRVLLARGKCGEAETCLRESIANGQLAGSKHVPWPGAASDLATLLVNQKRSSAAESVAIWSVEGMIKDTYPANARLLEADGPLLWLAELYRSQNRPALVEPYLEQCVKDALANEKNPRYLNDVSWTIAVEPGRPRALYELAVEAAAAADTIAPDESIQNTLGVAQFRAGLLQESLATLKKCDQMSPNDPNNVAFIAMASYQLGDREGAETELAQLDSLMQQETYKGNPECESFAKEARNLIGPGK